MPEANYNLLKYFIEFLTQVSKHAGANRMGVRNLALVFGASLLNPPEDVPYDLNNIKLQCEVIEQLIGNYAVIFEGAQEDQSTKRTEKQVATIPAGPSKPIAVPKKKNRSFFDRPQLSGSSPRTDIENFPKPSIPNSMSMSSNAVLLSNTKKLKKEKVRKKKKKKENLESSPRT